jgi:hypothetical protein
MDLRGVTTVSQADRTGAGGLVRGGDSSYSPCRRPPLGPAALLSPLPALGHIPIAVVAGFEELVLHPEHAHWPGALRNSEPNCWEGKPPPAPPIPLKGPPPGTKQTHRSCRRGRRSSRGPAADPDGTQTMPRPSRRTVAAACPEHRPVYTQTNAESRSALTDSQTRVRWQPSMPETVSPPTQKTQNPDGTQAATRDQTNQETQATPRPAKHAACRTTCAGTASAPSPSSAPRL